MQKTLVAYGCAMRTAMKHHWSPGRELGTLQRLGKQTRVVNRLCTLLHDT